MTTADATADAPNAADEARFKAAALRAIELTFSAPYRHDLPKALCAVLCEEFPEVLWATGSVGGQVRFGGVAPPTDYATTSMALEFAGQTYDIALVTSNPPTDDEAWYQGTCAIATQLKKQLLHHPALIAAWNLAHAEVGTSRVAVQLSRDVEWDHAPTLEVVCDVERRLVKTSIDVSRTTADVPRGGPDLSGEVFQVYRKFRLAMFDFLEVYLPRVAPASRVRATVFYALDPWTMTYSYRGLLPADFANLDVTGVHRHLNGEELSINGTKLDHNTLHHALGALLDPLQRRYPPESTDQTWLVVDLMQAMQQHYATGLLASLHGAENMVSLSGSLPRFVARSSSSSEDGRADQIRKYELALMEMGAGSYWIVSPVRAHGQVRALWFVQVEGAAAKSVWECIQRVGREVVSALGDLLAAAYAQQFYERADQLVRDAFTDAEVANSSAIASALPALVNTPLTGFVHPGQGESPSITFAHSAFSRSVVDPGLKVAITDAVHNERQGAAMAGERATPSVAAPTFRSLTTNPPLTLLVWGLEYGRGGHGHAVWAVTDAAQAPQASARMAPSLTADIAAWVMARNVARRGMEQEVLGFLKHHYTDRLDPFLEAAIVELAADNLALTVPPRGPTALYARLMACLIGFDFLVYADPADMKRCPTVVNEVVAVALYGSTNPDWWNRYSVTCNGDPRAWEVVTNPVRHEQHWIYLLLANVFSNAAKHGLKDSPVQVTVEMPKETSQELRVHVRNLCRKRDYVGHLEHIQAFVSGQASKHPVHNDDSQLSPRGLRMIRNVVGRGLAHVDFGFETAGEHTWAVVGIRLVVRPVSVGRSAHGH